MQLGMMDYGYGSMMSGWGREKERYPMNKQKLAMIQLNRKFI